MAKATKIPMTVFLDENVPEWRIMSEKELDSALQSLWNQKAFIQAVVFTRNCRAEPVVIKGTHFAFVKVTR